MVEKKELDSFMLGNGGELYASKATDDLLNLGNYGAFR